MMNSHLNEIKKLLDTPLALTIEINKDNFLLSPIGKIIIKNPHLLTSEEIKHSLFFKYYNVIETRIQQCRPSLKKKERFLLREKLLINIALFLDLTKICKYKKKTYYLKPVAKRGRPAIFVFRIYSGKFYLPGYFFTKADALNHLISIMPQATFFDSQAQSIASEIINRKQEEQKVQITEIDKRLERKLYWYNKIKQTLFTKVKLNKIKLDGSKELIEGYAYNGLVYTKNKNYYEIYHGSGVLVLDRIKLLQEVKIILVRLVDFFDWNTSLKSIQKNSKFDKLPELLVRMRFDPFFSNIN